MRLLLLFVLLSVSTCLQASEKDTKALQLAVLQLDQALIKKDSTALQTLLHEKVGYGHSNGWVETRAEVIDDLFNGKLQYNDIQTSNVDVTIVKYTASVRSESMFRIIYNGKPMELKLHVLQIWLYEEGSWKLLSRQSTKI